MGGGGALDVRECYSRLHAVLGGDTACGRLSGRLHAVVLKGGLRAASSASMS